MDGSKPMLTQAALNKFRDHKTKQSQSHECERGTCKEKGELFRVVQRRGQDESNQNSPFTCMSLSKYKVNKVLKMEVQLVRHLL